MQETMDKNTKETGELEDRAIGSVLNETEKKTEQKNNSESLN